MTPESITPEKAQELRDAATPGPWRVETEAPCECCTYVAAPAAAVCTPDPEDAPLIAAAPDLAHTVAGLRYEYAVEVDTPEGKAYALESDEGMVYHIANPAYADWEEDRDDMEIFATRAARDLAATTRVVRRLVSEPEVVS